MLPHVAIVGGGMMGQLYVSHLKGINVEPERIHIAEICADMRERILSLVPGIITYGTIEDIPHDCDIGIIAVPTSSHLQAARFLIENRISIKDILLEKPLCPWEQLEEAQELAGSLNDVNLRIGHLCNGSSAVSGLIEWCDRESYRPSQMYVEWEKYRKNQKPDRLTHGFVTDEMTHPLALAASMARHFGCTQWEIIEAKVITKPYANEERQKAAHEWNPLIPLNPNSEAHAKIRFFGDGDLITAHVGGSYTAEKKNRSMRVVTADRRSASIQFDHSTPSFEENHDMLCIERKDPKHISEDKLGNMLGAFMDHRPSDALLSPPDALDLVRMQAAILEMGK